MADKTNGHCNQQEDGCTELQLLETRVSRMEEFVKNYRDERKWERRWQKSTAVGVVVAIGLILFKIIVG